MNGFCVTLQSCGTKAVYMAEEETWFMKRTSLLAQENTSGYFTQKT